MVDILLVLCLHSRVVVIITRVIIILYCNRTERNNKKENFYNNNKYKMLSAVRVERVVEEQVCVCVSEVRIR